MTHTATTAPPPAGYAVGLADGLKEGYRMGYGDGWADGYTLLGYDPDGIGKVPNRDTLLFRLLDERQPA